MSEDVIETLPLTPADISTLLPQKNIESAAEDWAKLKSFIARELKEDLHFGIIPGTKKKSLWDPGAQAIAFYHGYGIRHEPVRDETVIDREKNYFCYVYRAIVFHKATGRIVADCVGSANNLENRFRWQHVYKNKLTRDEQEYVEANQVEEVDGKFRVPARDPYALLNNIMKRAQKRARVGAVITACRAATDFEYTEEPESDQQGAATQRKAQNKPAKKPATKGDGKAISEGQRKLIYARWKAAGIPDDEFMSHFATTYPYTVDEDGQPHTSRLNWQDLKGLLEWLDVKKEENAGSAQ